MDSPDYNVNQVYSHYNGDEEELSPRKKLLKEKKKLMRDERKRVNKQKRKGKKKKRSKVLELVYRDNLGYDRSEWEQQFGENNHAGTLELRRIKNILENVKI